MTKPMLKGWRDDSEKGHNASLALLSGMLDEVWEVAAPEESAAFLRSVGRRIAGVSPLDGLHSNDEIVATINAFWADLGWGGVELAFAEDGLHLRHHDIPSAPDMIPAGRWHDSFSAVISGAYDAWLGTLGGAAGMRTRLVAIRGNEAEFHYA